MLGISDEEFLRGDVPMTKREVRIVTIANAQLAEDAVVYDIGAGTGSLTIEAAAQVPHGHVYAIERKDEAVKLIRANLAHFGVEERVTVLAKEAPDGIEKLPPCDAVLIGGSGSHLAAILDAADEKLRPGGRIALNFITVQTLLAAIEWLRAHKAAYTYETIHVQVNRLRQVGPYDMAKAENPIYIVTAEKKE
jgi:precorrin-6Y C5,15-methyltransferase (decarboxylating) CbiT subunit